MQVSLQLIPEQPASELLEAIEIADELGYYACYSADEIYHKDAWLLFAAAAGAHRAHPAGSVRGSDLHARPELHRAAGGHPG